MSAPVLETRDLTIRFGGHVAVDAVSCAFAPGTLTAIVGPNGAGKTTYFNIMSASCRPSAGAVVLDGEDVTRLGPSARAKRGIGRAFQIHQPVPQPDGARERAPRGPGEGRGGGESVVALAQPRALDRARRALSRGGGARGSARHAGGRGLLWLRVRWVACPR